MNPGVFLSTLDPAIGGGDTGSLPPAGFAAQNAARISNFLSAGDASGLRITKNDTFIIGGWIKWNDNVDSVPFTKGDVNLGTESYGMYLSGSNGLITASVANGVSDTAIDAVTAIVSGVSAFVLMWVDSTTINISINNGTVATAICARINVADPGGNVVCFSNDDGLGGLGFKGILDEWFFCKNPASMTTAISTINTDIYNGGTGLRYKNVTAADKTTIGLVSWWTMDQATGSSRTDSSSTNDLTKTGTITQVSPIVA